MSTGAFLYCRRTTLLPGKRACRQSRRGCPARRAVLLRLTLALTLVDAMQARAWQVLHDSVSEVN